MIKICPTCKKEFESDKNHKNYCCMACRYPHRVTEETDKSLKKAKKKQPVTPLGTINAEARKRGLTYGQYAAILREEKLKEKAERERKKNENSGNDPRKHC